MRPRKSVNVASIVGSPEEEESRPSLRLRIVGLTVLVLFGLLVLRLWTLQVIDGKTYAAAVTRNQVRVVSIPAPRGEIVDRSGTVLVSNTSQEEILLSRAEALQNPGIVGMVAALVGQTPAQVKASINNVQYSPYEPVPVAVGISSPRCSTSRPISPDTRASASRRWLNAPTPRVGRQGPRCSATRATSRGASWPPTPTTATPRGARSEWRESRPSTSSTSSGVDGRQALSVDASGNVVGTLSTTAPQIGDTLVLNINTGLQQAGPGLPGPADPRPTVTRLDAVDGKYPPAINGAVIVMNPQQRRGPTPWRRTRPTT